MFENNVEIHTDDININFLENNYITNEYINSLSEFGYTQMVPLD